MVEAGRIAAMTHADAGSWLLHHFAEAALPTPEIHGEFAMVEAAAANEIGIETLEDRLRTAVVEAGAQVTVVLPQDMAAAPA